MARAGKDNPLGSCTAPGNGSKLQPSVPAAWNSAVWGTGKPELCHLHWVSTSQNTDICSWFGKLLPLKSLTACSLSSPSSTTGVCGNMNPISLECFFAPGAPVFHGAQWLCNTARQMDSQVQWAKNLQRDPLRLQIHSESPAWTRLKPNNFTFPPAPEAFLERSSL